MVQKSCDVYDYPSGFIIVFFFLSLFSSNLMIKISDNKYQLCPNNIVSWGQKKAALKAFFFRMLSFFCAAALSTSG